MDWKKMLVAMVLPQFAGVIGSIFTRESVATWYQQLNKPSFTPPSWVFAPVWTTLFLLMGWAFYLILLAGQDKARRATAISLFWGALTDGPQACLSRIFCGSLSRFS
jgi:tryptophan-rich sensory protein